MLILEISFNNVLWWILSRMSNFTFGSFVHTCLSVTFISILKILTIFMKSWPSWVLVVSHGRVCPVYLSNWTFSNTHHPSVNFDVLILGILTMYVNMSFTVKFDWWCGWTGSALLHLFLEIVTVPDHDQVSFIVAVPIIGDKM